MINKAILANELRKPGLSFRDAAVYINVIVKTITDSLSKGKSLQIRGLGTFYIQSVPEKKYPSLVSGKKTVPAHGRILFRPSKKLREAVWGFVNDNNAPFSV